MFNDENRKKLESIIEMELDEEEKDNFISVVLSGDTFQFNSLMDELSVRWEIPDEVYEIRYSTNSERTVKQRLESKFYYVYLLTKKKNNSFKIALANIFGYRFIKSHGFFDLGYYLKNNRDVMKSGDDPLMHYIYYGYREGRQPSKKFDGNYYLQTYPDVKDSNLNPLIHYSIYGVNECRSTLKRDSKFYKKF